jgi:hypothetical protein
MDASMTSTSEPISGPMRRVVDALIAGETIPADASDALTESERVEVAALARTAHLTSLTLARPEPAADVEAAALHQAHAAFAQRTSANPGAGGATSADRSWLSRLWARISGNGGPPRGKGTG